MKSNWDPAGKINKKTLISLAFYALIGVFLFFYLRNIDWAQLSGISINYTYIIIASVISLLFRYWGSFVWIEILKGLGGKKIDKLFPLVYVYSKAWLGRYVPGKFTWILSKVYFASKLGISKSKLVISSFLEGVLQTLVILFLSALVLFFDVRLNIFEGYVRYLMLGLSLTMLVSLSPPVFNRIIKFVFEKLKKQRFDVSNLVDWRTILRGAFLYGVGFVISGVAYFFLILSVEPGIGLGHLLFIMGVFNLAGAIGVLAFFTPSGLGAREGVQLILLSLLFSRELTLAIVVLARLWMIVLDLLFYFLTKGIYFIYQRISIDTGIDGSSKPKVN